MIPKIDLYSIKSFVQENLGWIVAIVLAFFLFQNCNGSDNSKAIAERETTIKILENSRASFIKKNNELQDKITINNIQIDKSNKKITSLEIENAKLKIKGDKIIAKLKGNDIKEWKNYYQEVTSLGNKDIKIIDTTLNFTRKPLIVIANKIIKGEVAIAQLSNANKIIAETKILANQNKENYEVEQDKNKNLQFLIKTDSLIKINQTKNIEDLEKDLKKVKKPKLVPILIGIGVGIVGGAVIAR